jgi:hypothetical protein
MLFNFSCFWFRPAFALTESVILAALLLTGVSHFRDHTSSERCT